MRPQRRGGGHVQGTLCSLWDLMGPSEGRNIEMTPNCCVVPVGEWTGWGCGGTGGRQELSQDGELGIVRRAELGHVRLTPEPRLLVPYCSPTQQTLQGPWACGRLPYRPYPAVGPSHSSSPRAPALFPFTAQRIKALRVT